MSSKLCPNGHVMDPSWDVCPYCQAKAISDTGPVVNNPAQPGAPQRRMTQVQQPAVGRKTALFTEKKEPLIGWLVVMNGKQRGQDFRLKAGKNLIGSDPGCDVVIREDFVSSQHASLSFKNNKFFITDLDSANGTFMNDKEISKMELKDLDEIKVGETDLRFKIF